ncbi:MAG: PIG-L family deacetylase [Candidatus Omnitrophica bacterium]|nr:PIG-L family deacetylase [Candidatus Omnitrophota bacterium]
MSSRCKASQRPRLNVTLRSLNTLTIAAGLALSLSGCRPPRSAQELLHSPVALTPQDRLLILAPHPDDEVLACGGVIQRAVAMGVPVRVVFFTYGDNNEWSFLMYRKHPVLRAKAVQQMGLVRHDEAMVAATRLGLLPEHLIFLGYPDFGTLRMWGAHWGTRPAFRSMLTHVTAVPYANAFRPGAPYKGEEVLHDLTTILRDFHPTKVFVSHPSDYMPDHSALYLFTRVALWDLESAWKPEVYPYLTHFTHWPTPRGYRPTALLLPPKLLQDQIPWQSHRLIPQEIERKRQALQAHRTQYAASATYLLSFVRANEVFGDFPVVTLHPSASQAPLEIGAGGHPIEAPEELWDEERAAFVGVETRSIQLDHETLTFSLEFSRPLAEAVQASIFLFGYRSDRPFAEMPKLHLWFGPIAHAIYDQNRLLPQQNVIIKRHFKRLTVQVPLALLGYPQRILTSARTSLGDVSLDWASWRIVELLPDALNGGTNPASHSAP